MDDRVIQIDRDTWRREDHGAATDDILTRYGFCKSFRTARSLGGNSRLARRRRLGERSAMRLFVALQPSPAFREALAGLQERLRAAGVEGRYLAPANLHLTLAFIGEWPGDVTACLPAVEAPFPITLSRIGVFPRAKVLWAGVQPSAALDGLAARVRQRLRAAGIPFDPQEFNPHITLIRKPLLPDEALLSDIRPQPAVMTVDEVCLYRSERRESGMAYTVIGRKKGTAYESGGLPAVPGK